MGLTLKSTGSCFKKRRKNEGVVLKWYGYSFKNMFLK